MTQTDARAIVTCIRNINESMDSIIQEQVKLNALLCVQVDKPVDKQMQEKTHRELMGTSPKPSKRPERILV